MTGSYNELHKKKRVYKESKAGVDLEKRTGGSNAEKEKRLRGTVRGKIQLVKARATS